MGHDPGRAVRRLAERRLTGHRLQRAPPEAIGRARGAAKPAGPPIQFSGPLPDLTWKCRITPVSFLGIEIDSTRNQASAPITAQLFHEGMNTSVHCRASGSISRRISDSPSPIALSPAASNNR